MLNLKSALFTKHRQNKKQKWEQPYVILVVLLTKTVLKIMLLLKGMRFAKGSIATRMKNANQMNLNNVENVVKYVCQGNQCDSAPKLSEGVCDSSSGSPSDLSGGEMGSDIGQKKPTGKTVSWYSCVLDTILVIYTGISLVHTETGWILDLVYLWRV